MGEVWLENHVEILKHLDLLDLKSEPLPRANAPPNNIEPHLDYSHRGVGPYGPEADSQLPPPARHRSRSGEFPNSGTRKRAGPTITSMEMSSIQKGPLPNSIKWPPARRAYASERGWV